jgi:GT2 family glycosyltransferase
MKLSVIMPCLNAADTIAVQLEALANQNWSEPWEVVVSNNGSSDGSMEIVKSYQRRVPNLRIVDATARTGQPYALNVGVQAAYSESIALCDADDEIAPGWVEAMGRALSKHDFVACRMGITKLNPSWLIKHRSNPQESGVQTFHYQPYLPHAGGGTLGFKRKLWNAVGGFDDEFPCLHDTDFCWKVQRMGIKLEFVPDAEMQIRFRSNIKGIFRQARSYGLYQVKLYRKYVSIDMPELPFRKRLSNLVKFIRRSARSLPTLRHREALAPWVWNVGWMIGRLKGSIKYRIFAP